MSKLKTTNMRKHLGIIAAALMLTGFSALAQKNVGDLYEAYTSQTSSDIQKLSQAYLKPYGETLGTNLNAGWYTSASPHKILGFDVTLMASFTMVPSSAKTFDVSKLGLQAFTVKNTPGNIAPTMSGCIAESKRPVLQLAGNDVLTLPDGSGATAMVTPMIQAAVGLPMSTEIMIRFMPEVEIPDYGSLGLWGVGVKHSLKDYIPFVKRVPFLQLSVLGAYTNFNCNLNLNSQYISNGKLDISSNAYTGRVLIGANLPMVAFYTGLGYGNASSTFDISGNVSNLPLAMGLKYDKGNFDFNLGCRLRLGVLALHADYSFGEYQMVTAGVGLSFR
jgi:hypothetical protein